MWTVASSIWMAVMTITKLGNWLAVPIGVLGLLMGMTATLFSATNAPREIVNRNYRTLWSTAKGFKTMLHKYREIHESYLKIKELKNGN